MAKVFVVHDDGRFMLDDARRYGDIHVVFDREMFPDSANKAMPGVMRRAYDVLAGFNADTDFLCLIGSPVYTAVCAYVLGDCHLHPVRMLRFDRIEKQYYEITIQ